MMVTLGGDGAWLVTDQAVEEFRACKVTPVDTTAAGDSFTAAFAVACSVARAIRRPLPLATAYPGS